MCSRSRIKNLLINWSFSLKDCISLSHTVFLSLSSQTRILGELLPDLTASGLLPGSPVVFAHEEDQPGVPPDTLSSGEAVLVRRRAFLHHHPQPSPQNLPLLHAQALSRVRLFATPWTLAHQVPLPMAFPRQGYWRGLPCPSPRDFSTPGMEPTSPALAGRFFTSEPRSQSIKLA